MTQLSGKREQFMSSLRKEKNEEMFMLRRIKLMQKTDKSMAEEVSPEFTMDDIVNGVAGEAIMKAKATKLKQAMETDKFSEILEIVTFFRRRLTLAKDDVLTSSQLRQFDIITDFVDILKKFRLINDSNRKIFEEVAWGMANYCSGGEHSIAHIIQYEFFEVALDIFENTSELELFQNVVSNKIDHPGTGKHLRCQYQTSRHFARKVQSRRKDNPCILAV